MATTNNTNIPLVKLPEIAPNVLFQPVSSMLRNCLISENPKLKELDFSHLQMYIAPITETVDTFNGQVLVKQKSDVRYRLESKQIFNYSRISAEEGLTLLGLTARQFDKSQFNDVSDYLSTIGTFTLLSGNITEENGDAVYRFQFGERYQEHTPARFIDLGSDDFVKADYSVAFKGFASFTFTGKAVEQENTPPPTTDEPMIDVGSFFMDTNLGNIFQS